MLFEHRNDDPDKAARFTLQGKSVVCCSVDDEVLIARVCDSPEQAQQFISENIDHSDSALSWFVYRLPAHLEPKPQPDVPDWDVPF